MAAFAQDRGLGILAAGNLLAFMGLTGLAGVIASGFASDRLGPIWPTAAAFAARIVVFGWIAVDQSPVSIAVFALVFGATFLVTAPLTVVFVRESFGTKNLGALAGLITMVHQIFGGVGAYAGAAIFDATGTYDAAFLLMLASAVVALALTLALRYSARAEGIRGAPRTPVLVQLIAWPLFGGYQPPQLLDLSLLLLHHRDQVGDDVLRLHYIRLALIEADQRRIDRRHLFGDQPMLGHIRRLLVGASLRPQRHHVRQCDLGRKAAIHTLELA